MLSTAPSYLPEDKDALKALVAALLGERDAEKQRANDLHIENLRLRIELDRYKKQYYGPRADQLQSTDELAQLLLNFAEQLDRTPVNPADVPPHAEPQEELRRVRRRKGRRNLANFESLPVTTHVYELNEAERACPCCGLTRKEIGADESWQVEYLSATSNGSTMCARSMSARPAKSMAIARGWRPPPSRRQPSRRAWPAPVCWPSS